MLGVLQLLSIWNDIFASNGPVPHGDALITTLLTGARQLICLTQPPFHFYVTSYPDTTFSLTQKVAAGKNSSVCFFIQDPDQHKKQTTNKTQFNNFMSSSLATTASIIPHFTLNLQSSTAYGKLQLIRLHGISC